MAYQSNQSKGRGFEKWPGCPPDPQGMGCRAGEASFDQVVWSTVFPMSGVSLRERVARRHPGDHGVRNPEGRVVNYERWGQFGSKTSAVPAQCPSAICESGKNMD